MGNTAFQPPTGLTNVDSVFSAPGRWSNGSLARFFQKGWQVKGGWERLSLENLGGVCRSTLAWTDASDSLNVAFGLHNGLKVWQNGLVWDVTPLSAGPLIPMTFPANQVVATTAGSPLVWCVVFNHNCIVGQQIRFTNLPFPIGGNVNLNGTWVVQAVVDVNNLKVTYSANATSTQTAGGTTGIAQPAPFTGFVPGQVDGTGGAGYGTGAFGVGTYGTPSTGDFFPLTWSLGTYGTLLIANPRNQTIYSWDTVTTNKAVAVAGAPARVTYTVVTPQRQLMALGCNEELSGTFNHLCIRWSDIEDITDWTTTPTNNAGEWILESGGRIVCGRIVGDFVFVWTLDGLFQGSFVGAPGQTWKFERIGSNCGAISPGAPIVKSQYVVWIAPDKTFWSCGLGGAPAVVDCEIRNMFSEHVTSGQEDKIIGASNATFSEFTWFWPDDRDGFECSRAMSFSKDGWSRDLLARTAFIDAGPQPYPIGVSPSGSAYWHEKGHTNDGAPLAGFIESTDFYLDEAEGGVMLNGVWPDFIGQQGSISLTVYTREFPQSTQRAHGPWSLAPGQSRRPIRVAGRIARVRFDWSSAPAYARGGKSEFESQRIGGR